MAWFWFFLCLGLVFAVAHIAFDLREERNKHEACHKDVFRTLTGTVARAKAQALREAAAAYDSVAATRDRQRLYRENPDGDRTTSIPALWLYHEGKKYESSLSEVLDD